MFITTAKTKQHDRVRKIFFCGVKKRKRDTLSGSAIGSIEMINILRSKGRVKQNHCSLMSFRGKPIANISKLLKRRIGDRLSIAAPRLYALE